MDRESLGLVSCVLQGKHATVVLCHYLMFLWPVTDWKYSSFFTDWPICDPSHQKTVYSCVVSSHCEPKMSVQGSLIWVKLRFFHEYISPTSVYLILGFYDIKLRVCLKCPLITLLCLFTLLHIVPSFWKHRHLKREKYRVNPLFVRTGHIYIPISYNRYKFVFYAYNVNDWWKRNVTF